MGKRISEEYLESIENLVLVGYEIGIKPVCLQADFQISRSTLYGILRKGGVISKRRSRKSTQEQSKQAVALYREGIAVNDIASQLKIGRGLIYHTLHEAGVELPNHSDRIEHALSDEQKSELVLLYTTKELSILGLVERFKVSMPVVYKILKKAGIERNHFTGPKLHFSRYVSPNGRLCRFRSTWEKAYAMYLDDRELEWGYESHSFLLSDGSAYTPDFWIPAWDVFVEVKGYMTDEARRKIKLFRLDFPLLKLLVVDRQAFALYGIDLIQKKSA